MYKSVSRIYKLGEGNLLSVDQSGINGDKTALCFSRYDGKKIIVLKTELIETQNDIDEFINKNMEEIYKVFGIKKELL